MTRPRRQLLCRRGRPSRPPPASPGPDGAAHGRAKWTPDLPYETDPYQASEHWPNALVSQRLPLTVHYPGGHQASAERVLAGLEGSWDANLQLGFRPPPIMPDRRTYDVWLWSGIEEVSVAARDEVSGTSWNDVYTYMIVDPDGPYGGDELHHTLLHEMNHVFQGADDWGEFASAYEGSATFVEWLHGGLNDRLREVVADFQSRPHWALDRDDGGKTWHTYGFAMYLRYLHHIAGGDARFLARAWHLARNRLGRGSHSNRVDLAEALEQALPGLDYARSVADFARWRWYTGDRADRAHDPDAAGIAAVPATVVRIDRPRRLALMPRPMLLGACYVDIHCEAAELSLSLETRRQRGITVTVQAVPGLDGTTDGDLVDLVDLADLADLAAGPARLRLGPDQRRTLIVTVVPSPGAAYDPDRKKTRTYPVTLVLAPTS